MSRSWKIWMPVLLSVAALVVATMTRAQIARSPSTSARTNTMVPTYDIAKEVKVQGTIQKIDGFGMSGPIGTHILLETASGVVDAHLGFGAASNPKYLGIAAGQNVVVTGMMETVGTTEVLMARILTTSNHIFVLRNEHGIPVRAIPRGNASPKSSASMGFATLNAEAHLGSGLISTSRETLLGDV